MWADKSVLSLIIVCVHVGFGPESRAPRTSTMLRCLRSRPQFRWTETLPQGSCWATKRWEQADRDFNKSSFTVEFYFPASDFLALRIKPRFMNLDVVYVVVGVLLFMESLLWIP